MNLMQSPLTHTSARVLEFESLRDLIRGYASSPLGQERIAALRPSVDRGWIENQHQLVTEIREYRRVGGRFEFSGLLDGSKTVEKSRISGAVLETTEIRDVILVVDRAAEWREIALSPPAAMKVEWKAVALLSSGIIDFTEFLRSFRNKIQPDGRLEDRASAELARIRREIERQKRLIQESLRGYLRRLAEGGAVQDELVTIRGERFVIPIKIEQKRRVQGVVHGASSSGQTVFVEPLETIDQNNELVRLLDEELAEIHRILLEMTRRIGESADPILKAADVLAELELQFAKARFAEDYNCVPVSLLEQDSDDHISPRGDSRPRLPEPGSARLVLHNTRHPLLERNLKTKKRPLVPIRIELESGNLELVITGPNTGGKTVALKTVGLLALMAQSGIPVPADRAELPVFDAVLADIGDYQSIEQNLSTFSAHVTNIVVNSSVGFDETTLQPTYELKVGVPGASAGINIAQRLGLNPSIIDAARSRLGTQARDVGQFLDRLHEQLREAEAERLLMKAREEELEREKARLAAEGRKEQQSKIREMEKKLETVLRDFEYQARETVNAIQDRAMAQKLTKDAERRMSKLRREFREQFDSTVVAHTTGADRGDPNAQPQVVKHVSEGDTVKLKSVGRPARISRRLDDHHFEVEIGVMKMKIARDDIAEVLVHAADSPVKAARARGISVSLEKENADVPSEINVIGRTVDDATREVEKFVDRAFLAGLPRVRVVHGSGMGILRKALRQYLQGHPHVESVTEPPQNEGGGGATVVELRV